MRILLFTGKGGVGKTTTAAATALQLADQGARVLVTSADPAHSLGDALAVELGDQPLEVAPGCHAQQIDARQRLEASWAEVRDWLVSVLDWAGVEAIEAEELAVLPGFDELFALTDLEATCRSGRYDAVVVDCAPTAETIRLLSLPEILSWYMDRLFPATRRMNRMVGPVLGRLTALPVAGDEVFAAGQRLHEQLEGVRRLLADPGVTSVRLVVNPERMVIAEARRTYTSLSLFGYQVDAVIVNRLLPEGQSGAFLSEWRATQLEHLEAIESSFAPLPILTAEHAGAEVVGPEALRRVAGRVWSDANPMDRLVDRRPVTLQRDGERFVLAFELPFMTGDEIDLTRSDDELFVTVGPHRRTLALPAALQRRVVHGAAVRDGRLEVTFVDPEPSAVRS